MDNLYLEGEGALNMALQMIGINLFYLQKQIMLMSSAGIIFG